MSFEGNIVVLLSFFRSCENDEKNGRTKTLLEEKFKAIIKKTLYIFSIKITAFFVEVVSCNVTQ